MTQKTKFEYILRPVSFSQLNGHTLLCLNIFTRYKGQI